jgi:hypothetical protein
MNNMQGCDSPYYVLREVVVNRYNDRESTENPKDLIELEEFRFEKGASVELVFEKRKSNNLVRLSS